MNFRVFGHNIFATSSLLMLALAAGAANADNSSSIQRRTHDGTLFVTVSAPGGGAGWQAYQNIAIPQGNNLAFTYQCPAGAATPVSGSFSPNAAAKAGLELIGSYRPMTQMSKWAWTIFWPSGAPAGARIVFNVYCVQ